MKPKKEDNDYHNRGKLLLRRQCVFKFAGLCCQESTGSHCACCTKTLAFQCGKNSLHVVLLTPAWFLEITRINFQVLTK